MGMSTVGAELLAATPGHLPHPQHIPPLSGRQSPSIVQAHQLPTQDSSTTLLKHHSHPLTTASSEL